VSYVTLRVRAQKRVGAILVGNSAFFNGRREQLAALAARHALPAIFAVREFALAGGLMIGKLNAAVADAHSQLTVQQRFAELGEEVPPREQQTPEALGAFQKAEIALAFVRAPQRRSSGSSSLQSCFCPKALRL
jgi:hypothetical protein